MARDPAEQPNLSGMKRVDLTVASVGPPARPTYPPAPNPLLRSPIPSDQQLSTDALRQIYRQGTSQFRLIPLPTAAKATVNSTAQGVAKTAAAQAVAAIQTVPAVTATSVSFTTALLAAGASQTGTVNMAKTFALFNVTVSAVGRVRLYSTGAAMTADAGRPNSVPPTPGLPNSIISDHYLNGTSGGPLNFPCSPVVLGSNEDGSQTTAIHYNVTNIGVSPVAITITLTYVQLEA